MGISFERVKYGKEWGEGNFSVQKLDKHCLGQVTKVNVNSDRSCLTVYTLAMIAWKWHFTSVVFPPKACNPSLQGLEKTSDKFQ